MSYRASTDTVAGRLSETEERLRQLERGLRSVNTAVSVVRTDKEVSGGLFLPAGGGAGESLVKNSDLDGDAIWSLITGGGGGGTTVIVEGGGVVVSTAPPVSPVDGTLWFDNTESIYRLYFWISDPGTWFQV